MECFLVVINVLLISPVYAGVSGIHWTYTGTLKKSYLVTYAFESNLSAEAFKKWECTQIFKPNNCNDTKMNTKHV